jgi:hypothetical protein
MPEWDIGPPFSSRLLESTVKVAIVVAVGAAGFFFMWGILDILQRGTESSKSLFLAAFGPLIVALFYYWYLQMLKKRRPPKSPPSD